MRNDTADPEDLTNNPKKWAHDARKGMDAFFDQGLITRLADQFMQMWPDWRYRYLECDNTVHIEYLYKTIGENHPCKALPRIYTYLYQSREAEPELSKLEEIKRESEEYLERLGEYDRKYDVDSWNPADFEENGLGARFNNAKADANEAYSVCCREIGHYYTRQGDTPKSMEHYRKAVDAYYDDEALHALLKYLMDTGQYAEAKRYCKEPHYAYLEYADPRFKKIRSFVHYNLKEYDECIAALTEILAEEDSEELRSILKQVIEKRKG